jgi:hypothetical protein
MWKSMVETDMTDNVEKYGRDRYDTDDNIIWCLHFDC